MRNDGWLRPAAGIAAWIVIAVRFAAAQGGVVEARPPVTLDPQCQLYIGPDLVLAFALDIKGHPVLNIINLTKEEKTLDASRITVRFLDGHQAQPGFLKIPSGDPKDPLLRSYLNIRPKSSFAVELAGLTGPLAELDLISVRVGSQLYRPEKVRKEAYDVLLEKLAQLDLDAENPGREFRRLNLPLKGAKSQVRE